VSTANAKLNNYIDINRDSAIAYEQRMVDHPTFRAERGLSRQGVDIVAGVDEVGRGPLAGPVAAGAVVLPAGIRASGRFRWLSRVRDSKQLTPAQREEIAPHIWEHAQAASVAFVSVEAIDRIGIAEASRQAMLAAIGGLSVQPHHLLIDAFRLAACSIAQTAIIRGDATSFSIACASIIAKVTRDRAMDYYHEAFPAFGFDHNKGYATAEHMQAIQLHGPCDLHRRSFSPVREMLTADAPEIRAFVPV